MHYEADLFGMAVHSQQSLIMSKLSNWKVIFLCYRSDLKYEGFESCKDERPESYSNTSFKYAVIEREDVTLRL